jgi:hypothetical protein
MQQHSHSRKGEDDLGFGEDDVLDLPSCYARFVFFELTIVVSELAMYD